MKSTTAVNFETYYFLELLETIGKSAARKFDNKSNNYLNKLLEYLKNEKTAQESIEKLAIAPSTSDLSIFFSDILDRLQAVPPEESMDKLSDRAQDFLEIFEVVLQNDEWKSAIDKEITVEEAFEEQPEEQLSFDEYCRHIIGQKIAAAAEDLPPEMQDPYREYLDALQSDPETAERLGEQFSEGRVAKFLDIHREIASGNRQPHVGEYMDRFEENAETWAHLFRDFLLDHFEEAARLFHPEAEAAEIPAEETEQPFEELFEDREAAIRFAEDEEFSEPVSEELEQLAEELEQRKARTVPGLSEEERQRRQFLRDYVVNEVNTFANEILSAASELIDSPGDSRMAGQLAESLKGLKDLGQIHAYPGIEKTADQLLQMVNRLQETDQALSGEEKPLLQTLFSLMPEYIDDAIAEDESSVLQKMDSQLSQLRAQLFMEEELVSGLTSADTLETSFQDVVSRFARAIDNELEAGVNAETQQKLAPAFDALHYWSELLLQNSARETVQCVQELLVPANYNRLSARDRQLISDIVKSWESAYVSESPGIWDDYCRQLKGLLPAGAAREEDVAQEEGVAIEEAILAYKDVALRQLREFAAGLQTASVSAGEIVSDHLPGLLGELQENSFLIGNDDLEILFRMLDIKLKNFDPADIQEPKTFKSGLAAFLGKLEAEIHSLPDPLETNNLLMEFDELLQQAVGETEDSVEELFEEEFAVAEEEETETAASSDQEILEVFNLEALNYIEELSGGVARLRSNPGNKQIWRDLGISTHTLKGSAQMVGREDIAQLADPFNKAIEMVEDGQLPASPELLAICQSFIDTLKRRIAGEPAESASVLQQLNDYIAGAGGEESELEEAPAGAGELEEELEIAIAEEPSEELSEEFEMAIAEDAPEETEIDLAAEFEEELSESAEEEIAEKPAPEEDLIYLEERDPELLEIFRSEVSNNFDIVERNLANLEKFSYDKEALQQGERAVHEIRAAAKMLGIGEISNIADKLESIFELLILHKTEDFDKVIPVTRRAMLVIRELTTRHSVRRSLYEEVIENLGNIIEAPEDVKVTITPEAFPPAPEAEEIPEPEEAEEFVEAPREENLEVTQQVMELYLQESREQLDDINYILLKLEKTPDDQELQHHLMRCMHTLKGSSGMVSVQKIEKLSHRSEDILEMTIKSKNPLPEELFNLLFETVDEIKILLDEREKEGKESGRNYEELLSKLDGYHQTASVKTEVEAPEMAEAEVAEVPAELVTIGKKKETESGAKETYLRLNINRMNHLLNLAAELVISNNQFKNQLDRLKNFIPLLNTNLKVFRDTEDYLNTLVREGKNLQESISPLMENKPGTRESLKKQIDNIQRVLKNVKNMQDEVTSITHMLKDNSKTYDENLGKINKLSNELLDDIMQARLVPINMLFQRFHRPIRDLANQLKKQIRLSISGEKTELDRTLVDELYEPLLHLIRNAIDHGLETAKERKDQGKDPEGLLEIKASRDRNQVIIEISDDGRGIDLDNVKKSAIEKGLLTEDDAKNMSDQELFEYLFYPGFSTAKETTLISGRGVGLDAVKSQIEKSKGDIRTYTEKGKGTTFNIRVPISLSVVQSMLVDVSGHVYSIPLMQVEETLHVSGQDLLMEKDGYYISYREKKIPVVQLNNLLRIRDLQVRPISADANYPVIMVQDEGNRVALLVEKIIRREEILIKSLGPGLRRLRYISGGSIMVDGQVVLVLDIPQIIQDIIKGVKPAVTPVAEAPRKEKKAAAPAAPRRKKKVVQGRKPVALIVDDSLSIRKYLSSLLMQKGFATETARNGYEALELLNKQEFDIMVTDLEMPKLSGYELIETLRYDQRFVAFPIIVLTGRAGENFRQLTSELGADAYIIKPFKDRELFEQIDKFIQQKV